MDSKRGLARWIRRLGVLVALGGVAVLVYSIVGAVMDAEAGVIDLDGPALAPVGGYLIAGGILLWVAGLVVVALGAPGVPLQTVAAHAAAPAAPAPAPPPDRLAQLEELARLNATGAITDSEFASRKAHILGGGT